MRKINVLHVIDKMDPALGGVCQAVRTIIKGLGEKNILSEVVCLEVSDAPFLKGDLFPVHALGLGKKPWSFSSRLSPWLVDNFSRFDAVLLHGLWLYNGYALYKAMRMFKRNRKNESMPNLYVMPHGMLDPYFQKAPGRKLKAMRNWVFWKLVERNVVNEADGLLFTCEEERRLAHEPFRPYNPKREIVIGLGVDDPPLFTPSMQNAFLKMCPELQGCPYILFLSRIHEKKGVELLINAYAELVRNKARAELLSVAGVPVGEGENSKFINTELPRLVIAGPGLDTSYGVRMQQLVSESEALRQSVFFPGMLSGDAKWGAFYGCEAFMLPSHQENFGIAVVEALACGKPVLISNQVNIWREIEAAGGGIVAEDTLAGALELLQIWVSLSNNEKLAMGQQAKSAFEKYFAVGPAAEKLLEVLNSQ